MQDFAGKIAVITGGGSGIGRSLAEQLLRAGAHVAICDVFPDNLDDARRELQSLGASGRFTTHLCDVAEEAQLQRFRDEVVRDHATKHIDLLFNNAGIGGGNSLIAEDRARWERTFNVCWLGVYYGTRTFLPLLMASKDSWLVNTSSVHGLLAREPGGGPQSAYSAAKFAVRGFSESLIADLRVHAPHVHVALVIPGHVGTSIVQNTMRSLNQKFPSAMTPAELDGARRRMRRAGAPEPTDAEVRALLDKRIEEFRTHAPVSAAQAATIILDGIRAGKWRILVGEDAEQLDVLVRAQPEAVYEAAPLPEFARLFPLAASGAPPPKS